MVKLSFPQMCLHVCVQILLNKQNGHRIAGKVPNPHLAPYSTAKHGLEGFFGSLRDEFIMGKKDISISICTIGLIGKCENTFLFFFKI